MSNRVRNESSATRARGDTLEIEIARSKDAEALMQRYRALLARIGHTRFGVFFIRTVMWRVDRVLYRFTNGRLLSLGPAVAPTLLLTVTGRVSGKEHTCPLFYHREQDRLVVVCTDAQGPTARQWPKNLLAQPLVRVRIGSVSAPYHARLTTDDEAARYWPALVAMYPPYATYARRFAGTVMFVLVPQHAETNAGPAG